MEIMKFINWFGIFVNEIDKDIYPDNKDNIVSW